MKYFIIISLLFLGCKNTLDPKQNYKKGDIIYIKPDSIKVVIYGIYFDGYRAEYRDKLGINRKIQIDFFEIY